MLTRLALRILRPIVVPLLVEALEQKDKQALAAVSRTINAAITGDSASIGRAFSYGQIHRY